MSGGYPGQAVLDLASRASSDRDSSGGGGGGSGTPGGAAAAAPREEIAGLGRLTLLNKLKKAQAGKAAGPGGAAAPPRAGRAAGGGAGARAGAAGGGGAAAGGAGVAPRYAAFDGRVEQDRSGAWALKGFDAELAALRERLPALQSRLRAAVKAEQAEQAAELRRLYATSSLERLAQDGVLLLPLRAAPHGVEFGQMIWKMAGPRAGQDLPHHKFKAGDSVLIRRHAASGGGAAQQRRGGGFSSVEDEGEGGEDEEGPGGVGLGPGGGPATISATVQTVTKKHLMVAMDKGDSDVMQAELASSPTLVPAELASSPALVPVDWRMDQAENDATSKRQLEAIARLGQLHDEEHPAFEQLARCCVVGSPSSADAARIPPLWVRDRGWRAAAKAQLAAQDGLNRSQRKAIADAMISSVTLWQGPPGTGKTATLLALIQVLVGAAKGAFSAAEASRAAAAGAPPDANGGATRKEALEAARKRWAQMGPVLAAANTNAATDNILEGLAARGVNVVRLGQPAKVREALRHLSLEARAEATEDGQRAVELRRTSKELFDAAKQAAEGASSSDAGWTSLVPSARGGGAAGGAAAGGRPRGGEDARALDQRARAEWGKAEALMRSARKEVLDAAEVVCATCSGAGDNDLNGRTFRMVVIDEASQATEPATLVPLTRGAHCVVALEQCGLDVTLFERMVDSGLELLLLDTQYRMHPAIAEFPSAHFYEGKLRSGVTAAQRPPARGVAWPAAGAPLAVLRVEGREERADTGGSRAQRVAAQALAERGGGGGRGGGSYRNTEEARAALAAVEALAGGGDVRSIALLTPYRGQVRLLERALRVLGDSWLPPGVELVVSSVDAFQGREADAVVFSAVRCNPQGKIGFVEDARRLNVAITRPKRALVVVCSPDTLAAGSRHWAAFLSHAAALGAVASPEAALPPPRFGGGGADPFDPAAAGRLGFR
ncbi:MAG: P-loop containing nucleoside triphosphate hydrolase protein [Monoraphidium minutum]|nr:MAG: P-loop containing nucleoside triphosphate hydrolase protein [Monoraphidium minutum]